ncbi:uncharacterized protein LOC134933240 [Pseudophryne corroboree]|uniref:uncharacterized protein LOC134933240 n=1 Tax=Pseudophryne corroboree TaxID=495146 RepID=UPI003081FFB1
MQLTDSCHQRNTSSVTRSCHSHLRAPNASYTQCATVWLKWTSLQDVYRIFTGCGQGHFPKIPFHVLLTSFDTHNQDDGSVVHVLEVGYICSAEPCTELLLLRPSPEAVRPGSGESLDPLDAEAAGCRRKRKTPAATPVCCGSHRIHIGCLTMRVHGLGPLTNVYSKYPPKKLNVCTPVPTLLCEQMCTLPSTDCIEQWRLNGGEVCCPCL